MQQYSMTEEDTSITREDLYKIAEAHDGDIVGLITELEQLGKTKEFIDKVLADLASY